MRTHIPSLIAFCLLGSTMALATESQAVPTDTATTAEARPAPGPANAPSSTAPAAGAPATSNPTAPPVADAAVPDEAGSQAEIKKMRMMGYKPETRGGRRLYCRSEAALGTRFSQKTCSSAEEVERVSRASRDAIDDAQRRSSSNPAKP